MPASQSLPTSIRHGCSQSPLSFFIRSNHQRSRMHKASQPRLNSRSLHSTPRRHAQDDKKPPLRNPYQDLMTETRSPAPKSQASDLDPLRGILSQARNDSLTKLTRPTSPTSTTGPSINELMSGLQAELNQPSTNNTSSMRLRLKPTLGRTVDVMYGDPTRAFRVLERKCQENNVRLDHRNQEKHVRRGQKKKNTRILRWRQLFMAGFKRELGTIQRMRRQGW